MNFLRHAAGPSFLVVAFGALLLAAFGAMQAKQSEPVPDATRVYKTLAGGQTLSIWYFFPPGHSRNDKRSAVLLFHGGSWRRGTPASMVPQAKHFASLGMSVEYRVTERHGSNLLDSTKDARSAMRWVKAHASELGIDPARIVAGGGSAGGHLAAALATTDRVNEAGEDLAVDPMPAALLLFNPALNFKYPGFLKGAMAAAAKAAGHGIDDLLVADPFANVKSKMPPCLIFHGTADVTVPIGAVREFAKAVKGACEVVAYEGASHGFFNRNEKDFVDTMRRSDAFLSAHGLLAAP